MARGRMIDKRVGKSKKIAEASDRSKVIWFMIYPHLDREGRISFSDIEDLKIECFPYFKKYSIKSIILSLNELADVGLIVIYPNSKNEQIAIQFNRFEDFQLGMRKDREAESTVSTPDDSGVFRITPEDGRLRKEVKDKVKLKEYKEYCPDKIINFCNITLTNFLIDLMVDNDPKAKTPEFMSPQFYKWADEIRLARTSDNRSKIEIMAAIIFSQHSDFWKSNIRSTSKLRKQIPTLLHQIEEYLNRRKQSGIDVGGRKDKAIIRIYKQAMIDRMKRKGDES